MPTSQVAQQNTVAQDVYVVRGEDGEARFRIDRERQLLEIEAPQLHEKLDLHSEDIEQLLAEVDQDDLFGEIHGERDTLDLEATLSFYRRCIEEAVADDPMWGLSQRQAELAHWLVERWGQEACRTPKEFLTLCWTPAGRTLRRAFRDKLDAGKYTPEDIDRVEEILDQPVAVATYPVVLQVFWQQYWVPFIRQLGGGCPLRRVK